MSNSYNIWYIPCICSPGNNLLISSNSFFRYGSPRSVDDMLDMYEENPVYELRKRAGPDSEHFSRSKKYYIDSMKNYHFRLNTFSLRFHDIFSFLFSESSPGIDKLVRKDCKGISIFSEPRASSTKWSQGINWWLAVDVCFWTTKDGQEMMWEFLKALKRH